MINERSSVPGDLRRLEVYVNGKDVSAAVTDVHIYMDIIGGFWTAKLFFEDSTNLMSRLNIKSGAEVKVVAETKLESVGDALKEFTFAVYNVTDKMKHNHMQYTYTVHCAAKAFLVDQKKRVNKFYEGNALDAVDSITSEFLGASLRDTRTPEGNVRFIATNQSPANAISWAAKWAVFSGKADFLFFQADNEQFDFMPVSAMYNDRDTGLTFMQRPSGIKDRGDGTYDPAVTFIGQQNTHYDALKAGLSGYFASKNASFDFIEKTWRVDDFTGDSEGGENEFEDMAEAHISFNPRHPEMYTGVENIYDTVKEWTGSRRAELMKLEREKIFIQTPAAMGAWKWLGHRVKIDLPSMEDITTDQYDSLRAGKYLVTAIAFLLGKAEAVTNYEMVKYKLGE